MGKEYFYKDPETGKENSVRLGADERGDQLLKVQELARRGLIYASKHYDEKPPVPPAPPAGS